MTTPVFIVGSDRSGTTLLRLIVNEHSALSVPAETWFLIDLIAEFGEQAILDSAGVDRAIEIVTSKRRWRNFTVSPKALRTALSSSPDVSLARFFDVLMTLEIAPTGKSRWVDKTPEYVLHLEPLASMFPTAKFVEIRRDGRDVFRSLKKQRWRGRTPVRIGRYWGACIDSATAASLSLPDARWLSVRYEDLVLDLEATTRRVCEFLEVAYEPAMLAFHVTAADHVPVHSIERGFHTKLLRPPSSADVYKWKEDGGGWQGWLFEAIVRRQLVESGYEPRLSQTSARVLGWAAHVHHVVSSGWVKVTKSLQRSAPAPGPASQPLAPFIPESVPEPGQQPER